ncbi:MAG: hypothetical protein H3C34_01830 [Caldilineaceae bacterium]|nr:hypothetical protein [Caldilineaceae bacterium]
MATVHGVFATPDRRPRGRLLLSFRKEHLAEISEQVKQNRIDVTRVLLAPLDRSAVVEVVRGPADVSRLKAKYNLTVEPDLAERIADDLTADPESPVATVLQLLLTKLWAAAREEATAAPVFSHQLYAQLQRSGLHLGAFVDEQLAALEQMWPAAKETENPVRSGYVLDLLAFHTTDHGTAEHRLLREVEAHYGHRGEWQEIVQRTKDVRLLADRPGDSPDQETLQGTRLAHDTVAPLVRGRFAESDAPGQRARRILETRVVDYAHGDRDTYLDDADLAIVEAGQRGMRLWTTDEQGLVEDSQHERDARRRRALIVRVMALAAVVAILLSSAVAWWLYGESQRQRDQALINDSRRLAGLSTQELATDPVVALHLALAGLPSQGQTRPRVPEAEAALRQSVLESRERRYVRTGLVAASQVAVHNGTIAVGGTGLTLYDTQLNQIAGRDLISATVDGVRWHPDDDRLLAWSGGDLFVIDGSAIVAQHTLPDFAPVLCAQWQPGGNVVALCAGDALVLWEIDDDALIQVAPTLEFEDSATFPREALWSHDGRYVAGWGARLVIWDDRAQRVVADRHDTARAQGFVASAQWTPADEALVAYWDGERSFTVWTPSDDEAQVVNLPGADASEGRAEDEDTLEALRIGLAGSDRVVVLNQHRGQLSLVGLDGRQIGLPMALQVGLFANMAMSPDGAGVAVYGAGGVQVGAIESLAGVTGSEGFSGFTTFYQSSGGGTEVKEVFWIDQEQLVVQTGDGFVRGYWMESALNLSEVKLPAVESAASLAGVWLTPEGELLTATYSGAEGSSLRLWQVAPRATTPSELAALSDQPICSQLRRILVYPGSEDSGAAWSDISWPAADVFMAMDTHGAVARWQSGGSDPLVLAQAALPVFATLPGASGAEVLRILEQDAELWRVAFEQWQRALLIPGTYRAGAWAGDKLALLDGDGVVHVSSHDGSEIFGEIPATDDPVLIMDASSDGHWLALKHSSGQLSLYSLRENPPKLEAAWEIPFAVQPGTIDLHPTEPLVLHARPGELGIWRAGRDSPIWTYASLPEGQLLSVQEARWSPDGASMALAGISSTDFGGEVELLRWDGRAQTVELLQHVGGSRPRWSPQGDYLLVSLDTATQRVVPVWPDERRLFEDAHKSCVLTRPLSDSQKRVYVLNEAP